MRTHVALPAIAVSRPRMAPPALRRFRAGQFLLGAAFFAVPVLAQDGARPDKPAPAQPAPAAQSGQPAAAAVPAAKPAAPADPQIESFKSMISGSWKASGKDPATGEEGEFWMHIAPVTTVEGMDNALYVEQSRGDDPATPYRQAIFQVYRNRGKLRLRTLEFRSASPEGGPWALMWLAPDLFPAVEPKNLIATMDLEFTPASAGFDGHSPYPYPNADHGAVEMTSEMKISKDKLVTTDKGYGPDGKAVWSTSGGSASPDSLTWSHADAGFKVDRSDDGLVIITVDQPADGATPAEGDTLFFDYAYWLADGTLLDSSEKRGRPMQLPFPIPTQGGMPAGLSRGMAGMTGGASRRLVVPPALAFGDTPRPGIPPGSALYFQISLNTVQKPAPPAPEVPAGGQPDADEGSAPEKPADGGH